MFGKRSGGRRRRSGAAPTFPTAPWSTVKWTGRVVGTKQLYFQPCRGVCNCETWLDAFAEATIDARWTNEGQEGDWSISSGTLKADAVGATITRERLIDAKCSTDSVFIISVNVTCAVDATARKFRVIFDWLDSDNFQYVECTVGATTGDTCRTGSVAIYQVVAGVATAIGQSETVTYADILWHSGVYVHVSRAGETDRWYVDVSTANSGTWVWALTNRMGTKCGLGRDPEEIGTEGVLTFDNFQITNCTRSAVSSGGGVCQYARAAGAQVVAGTISAGSETSLLDPTLDSLTITPDENGTADIIIPIKFLSDGRDPRAITAHYELDGAVSGTAAEWAVWNTVEDRWEETFSGREYPHIIIPGEAALIAIINTDHIDSNGYAGVRIKATSTGAWTLIVRYVRGFRDEYTPIPSYFVEITGSGLDALVDGQTFEMPWVEDCASGGKWIYTVTDTDEISEYTLTISTLGYPYTPSGGYFPTVRFQVNIVITRGLSGSEYQGNCYPTPIYECYAIQDVAFQFTEYKSGGNWLELETPVDATLTAGPR